MIQSPRINATIAPANLYPNSNAYNLIELIISSIGQFLAAKIKLEMKS